MGTKPRVTNTRVWLGEDIPGLEYWEWCDGAWYERCEAVPLLCGNVFILKSDRKLKPKRKPGLVRACYSQADLRR